MTHIGDIAGNDIAKRSFADRKTFRCHQQLRRGELKKSASVGLLTVYLCVFCFYRNFKEVDYEEANFTFFA